MTWESLGTYDMHYWQIYLSSRYSSIVSPICVSFRYAWQFITLAGFHSNGLIVTKLARSFGDEGMLAYVRDIQRQEKVEEIELLKHQKWSGAELVDKMVNVASGGQSSTAAMGAGVTEDQFGKH